MKRILSIASAIVLWSVATVAYTADYTVTCMGGATIDYNVTVDGIAVAVSASCNTLNNNVIHRLQGDPDGVRIYLENRKKAGSPIQGTVQVNVVDVDTTASQWLASRFKGTDVVGNNDEKLGDVSDFLFDRNGMVTAYVVSVGGFLGIGSKDVALHPSSFQVVRVLGIEVLKLSMTKDQLKQAPTFVQPRR